MTDKKEINQEAGKPAMKWKENNPKDFKVTNPLVNQGIKGSLDSRAKGEAQQPRFKAWSKGIDYDAIEKHYRDGG